MSVLRFIDQHLAGPSSQGLGARLHARALAYIRAETIVRAYYALGLIWVVTQMSAWPRLIDVDAADPQWPAAWLEHVDLQRGIHVILIGYLFAALLAATAPSWRLARLAYFVMLLQYLAIQYGFGKVSHSYHAWLFVGAVFVLLPDRRWRGEAMTRAAQSYFLSVVAAAQVVVLFLYTLTGLWKILFALNDLTTSRVSGFELKGFSYIVADRLLTTNQDSVLGEFFVHNHVVGWLLYTGTIYLESASLLIAFRPRLHRAWGIGLILFHLGTQLAMGFTFLPNVALIGLLFVASPFAPDHQTVRDTVLDLPGVRLAHRLVRAP